MDPGARTSTDPAPATPAPLDARPTGSAAATEDSKWPPLPRPAAKSEARGGTTATERQPRQRSKSTRQAIQTPRYPGAIFSLTATSTSESYGGGLQDDGVQPPSASFCRGTRYTVELFGRTRPPLQARAKAKPQGKSQTLPGPLSTETCGR